MSSATLAADSTSYRFIRAALPCLAALPMLALLIHRFSFVCDDAFISFRYSRHLAQGFGLRYNLGPEAPVEGYSELLWVLWMALFEWSGLDVTYWSRATSILCTVVLLATVVVMGRQRLGWSPVVATGTAWFFATLPPIAVWATGGLATLPFTLAVFLLFASMFCAPGPPRPGAASLSAAAAVLLRADGLYWCGLIVGMAGAIGLWKRDRAAWRAALVVSVTTALVTGVHVLWRAWYYGPLLPNTALVKVGLSALSLERGFNYALSFLLVFPVVGLVVLWGAARTLRLSQVGLVSLVVVAGTFFYAVLVGGDFMCMGRFLVPALPFVCLLFAELLKETERRTTGRRGAALLALVASAPSLLPAFNLDLLPHALRARWGFRWNNAEHESEYDVWHGMVSKARYWRLLGRALKLHTRPGESLVADAIGAIGYESGLFIYDQHGLVTREVALNPTSPRRCSPGHDKFVEATFFYPHRPTYTHTSLKPASSPDGRPGRRIEAYRGVEEEVESIPLASGPGFPPGLSLVLVRSKRPIEPRGKPKGLPP